MSPIGSHIWTLGPHLVTLLLSGKEEQPWWRMDITGARNLFLLQPSHYFMYLVEDVISQLPSPADTPTACCCLSQSWWTLTPLEHCAKQTLYSIICFRPWCFTIAIGKLLIHQLLTNSLYEILEYFLSLSLEPTLVIAIMVTQLYFVIDGVHRNISHRYP